jgi:hypothetical protein
MSTGRGVSNSRWVATTDGALRLDGRVRYGYTLNYESVISAGTSLSEAVMREAGLPVSMGPPNDG